MKKIKQIMSRGMILTIIMIAAFFCQIMGVSAKEIDQMPDLEVGRKGTLSSTLSYKDEDETKIYIEGVTLQAIKVADLTVINGGSSTYTLTSDFSETGINFEGMAASDSHKAAKDLKAIVLEKELSGLSAVTDANGKAVFEEVEPGMYLILQTANADTVPLYTEMDPYLISVPLGETEEGNNVWNYNVETLPKVEIGRKPVPCSIQVTKRVSMNIGGETIVLSVEDATFYVGLFKNAAGTKPFSEDYIKAIHIENASVGTVEYTDLPEGTYYVYETYEDGMIIKPGETAEDAVVPFVCILEGNGQQKVVLDPDEGVTKGEVAFNNRYGDLPTGYYVDGEINIKKSVFQGNDRVNVEDTFYAGIFTKENGSYVLNQVVELEQNKTVTVPVLLQGSEGNESVEYWVFETDENGKRINKEKFSYEVTGEGSVKISVDNLHQDVEIVNTIKEEEETSTEVTTTSSVDDVKTGDDTPIIMYVMLLAAALLVIIAVVAVRLARRKI